MTSEVRSVAYEEASTRETGNPILVRYLVGLRKNLITPSPELQSSVSFDMTIP